MQSNAVIISLGKRTLSVLFFAAWVLAGRRAFEGTGFECWDLLQVGRCGNTASGDLKLVRSPPLRIISHLLRGNLEALGEGSEFLTPRVIFFVDASDFGRGAVHAVQVVLGDVERIKILIKLLQFVVELLVIQVRIFILESITFNPVFTKTRV